MTQDTYELRTGSKYLVKMSDEGETIGVFEGYVMIGSESAIVIRCNIGADRIRFIPVTQIVYMDLLESSEETESKTKSQPEHLYG